MERKGQTMTHKSIVCFYVSLEGDGESLKVLNSFCEDFFSSVENKW